MPHGDPDPEDPLMLVGVVLPADRAAQVEMAAVFAEEFARMGYEEPQILHLFRQPFYAGAHDAWRRLGEAEIAAIVREVAGVWGRVRPVDRDAPPAAGCGGEGHGHG